jgi:hypothetical protein
MPGQMNPQADGLDVPVGLPAAPFQPSQPQGAPATRQRVILPGCNYPPADAVPVDKIVEGDIPSASTALEFITVDVPDTLTFRLAGIGFGAVNPVALGFLSWSLTATPPAGTITPYVNMPASIGSIAHLSWVFVVIGSSVRLALNMTNGDLVNTYRFAARIQGWFYAEREVVT